MISKHGLKKGPQTELSWNQGPFLGSTHLPRADCAPGNHPQPLPHQDVNARLLRGSACPLTCAAGSHAIHVPSSQVQLSTNPSRFQPQCLTPRCSFQGPTWSHMHSLLAPLKRMLFPICTPGHICPQVTCNPLWAFITGRSQVLAATSLTQRARLAVSFQDLGCALHWWPELPVARTRRRNAGCRPSVDTE